MRSPHTSRQDRDDLRRRSRSPYRHKPQHDVRRARSRSRSRSRRRYENHRRHHRRSPPAGIRLPFQRTRLHKADLTEYRNLLAEYLDVQKSIDFAGISENEVKGRWKSFLGKWNRKELAEGWYDPDMKARVDERFASQDTENRLLFVDRDPAPRTAEDRLEPRGNLHRNRADAENEVDNGDENEDEENYGPSLPDRVTRRAPGPAIPGLQDLQQRDELLDDDRAVQAASQRFARKMDRKQQAERLDELAPRADPGSRERQLEKKRAAADTNRGFREAKSPGATEVGERDLMGDDDGGADGYRARLQARDRIKNEREIRKEEVLRARAAEREERLAEHRRKEEKTMEALKAIAKQRFG